jgi:hypothetical protein
MDGCAGATVGSWQLTVGRGVRFTTRRELPSYLPPHHSFVYVMNDRPGTRRAPDQAQYYYCTVPLYRFLYRAGGRGPLMIPLRLGSTAVG